jgi:hypothetical protein
MVMEVIKKNPGIAAIYNHFNLRRNFKDFDDSRPPEPGAPEPDGDDGGYESPGSDDDDDDDDDGDYRTPGGTN